MNKLDKKLYSKFDGVETLARLSLAVADYDSPLTTRWNFVMNENYPPERQPDASPPPSPNLQDTWKSFISGRTSLHEWKEDTIESTPPSLSEDRRLSLQGDELASSGLLSELLEQAKDREAEYLERKREQLAGKLEQTITKQLKFGHAASGMMTTSNHVANQESSTPLLIGSWEALSTSGQSTSKTPSSAALGTWNRALPTESSGSLEGPVPSESPASLDMPMQPPAVGSTGRRFNLYDDSPSAIQSHMDPKAPPIETPFRSTLPLASPGLSLGEWKNHPDRQELKTPETASMHDSRMPVVSKVGSLFTTGSSKPIQISSASMEKAAKSLASSGETSPLRNPTERPLRKADDMDIESAAEIGTKKLGLPTSQQVLPNKHSKSMATPSNTSMPVASLFESASGKRVKIDNEKLEKASRAMVDELERGKDQSVAIADVQQLLSSESSSRATTNEKRTVPPNRKSTSRPFVRPRPKSTTAVSSTPQVVPSNPPPVAPAASKFIPNTAPEPAHSSQAPHDTPLEKTGSTPKPLLPKLHLRKTDLLNAESVLNQIHSTNALCVSFALDRSTPILADLPCKYTLEKLSDILLVNFEHPRLDSSWVKNHYRWIVWKLACLERLKFPGKKLSFENVAQQLTKRAITEFQNGHRSAIFKMLRGDLCLDSIFVMVFSRVLSEEEEEYIVELSDGWYAVEAAFDAELSAMVFSCRLFPGAKIAFTRAKWSIESVDVQCPLQLECNSAGKSSSLQSQPRLRLAMNHTKPARWDSRLGSYRNRKSFTKSISSLQASSELIPRMQIFIQRRSLLLFREQESNGSFMVRNEREETRIARENLAEWDAYKDRVQAHIYRSNACLEKPNGDVRELVDFFMETDSNKPLKRDVTPFVRLAVKDESSVQTVTFTVWNPSAQVLEMLKEGCVLGVTEVSITKSTSSSNTQNGKLEGTRFHSTSASTWQVQENHSPQVWSRYEGCPRGYSKVLSPDGVYDTVLVLVMQSMENRVAFAMRFEEKNSDLVALSFRSKSRMQELPNERGTVIAVRDLLVKSYNPRNQVLNSMVIEETALSMDPTTEAGFEHLKQPFANAKAWIQGRKARSILSIAVNRVQAVLYGTPVQMAVSETKKFRLAVSNESLTCITLGKQRIEARLARGVICGIQPGATIRFDCGELFQEAIAMDVRSYPSFKVLLEREGFDKVAPWAPSLKHALHELSQRYGAEEMEFGVSAIEIKAKDVVPDQLVLSSSKKKPAAMEI